MKKLFSISLLFFTLISSAQTIKQKQVDGLIDSLALRKPVSSSVPVIFKVENGRAKAFINEQFTDKSSASSHIGAFDLQKISDNVLASGFTDGIVVCNYRDSALFLVGGWTDAPSTTDTVRVSYDGGITWAFKSLLPYPVHTIAKVKTEDGYFVFMGADYLGTTTQKKTVFRTVDFSSFETMTTTAPWAARVLGTAWTYEGKIRFGGGQSDVGATPTYYNDIWESADYGATWTQITASSMADNGDSVMRGNAYNTIGKLGPADYKITSNRYGSYLNNKFYKSLDGGISWKHMSTVPFTVGGYPSVEEWDGKVWVIAGNNGVTNSNTVGYLDRNDEWHQIQSYSGTNTAATLTLSHASDLVVYKDHLVYPLGNVKNDVWTISRSNILEAHSVRDSLKINGDIFLSQVRGSRAALWGYNIKPGATDNTYIHSATDLGLAQTLNYNEGFKWIMSDATVGTENVTSTGVKMKLNTTGNLVISANNSYDAGSSYKLQVDGPTNLNGGITSPWFASAIDRMAYWQANGQHNYTSFGPNDIVLNTGSYADPSWITSLAYSKLTGAPSGSGGMKIADPVIDGEASRVLFVGSVGQLAQSNKFNFDSTNSWLGVGITPAAPLHISRASGDEIVRFENANAKLSIGADASGVYFQPTTIDPLYFYNSAGTSHLKLSSTGLNIAGGTYLNFNTTEGSTGYGLRANSGTMQFKNSGGSWADFGSGGGTPGGSNTQVQYNNSSAFAGAANLTIVGGVPTLTNINQGLQLVTTSGGTTTLTISSPFETVLTGASNHGVNLPNATTLAVGHRLRITNRSTGQIFVRDNGVNNLSIFGNGYSYDAVLIDNSTTNGVWHFTSLNPALSLTTTGTSGAASYNVATGELNIPNYGSGGSTTFAGLTDVNVASLANNDFSVYDLSTSKWVNKTSAQAKSILGITLADISGSIGTTPFHITGNPSNNGSLWATSTGSQAAIFADNTSTGRAAYFTSKDGEALVLERTTTSGTTDISIGERYLRYTAGTAANGFGQKILYDLENSTGSSSTTAAEFQYKWTDATNTTESAQVDVNVKSAGTLVSGLTITPTQLKFNNGANTVASLAGTETLTNKTIASATNNVEGTLLNVRFLTSGTTYTPTSGTTKALIVMIGAGGGGGGVTGAATSVGAAGGGGAGGYCVKFITGVTGTYTYAIGTAGTAGANTGGNGGNGGNTTFANGATTYTAFGGSGGVGQTAGTAAAFILGGAGAVVSTNGDINAGGSPGLMAYRVSGTLGYSGTGGDTEYGGAGIGLTSAAAGNAATGFGAGGGGALSTANTARAGGAGAPGLIIIYEYK